MRILQIITQGECGGAQKNVLDTSIYFQRKNNNIFVAIGNQESKSDAWLFQELKKGGIKKENLISIPTLYRKINLAKDIQTFFETYTLVKRIKPHIVHTHSSKAGIICGIAAKIAGSHVIYTVHGFVFSEQLSLLKKGFYILAEFTASFFRDLTITVSEFDRKNGERFFVIRKNKGIVIYNGIKLENSAAILSREKAREFIFEKINFSETKKNKEEFKIVGVVANLYKTKGLEYLIEAVDIIKNEIKWNKALLFVVFGEGELRNKFTKKISEKRLEKILFFPGLVHDAFKYLKGFDLVVLPSVKEGLPYILLESMLAGVPFIATRVGGVPEITKFTGEKNLISPCDARELSNAILSHFLNFHPNQYLLPKEFSFDYASSLLAFQYEKITSIMPSCFQNKNFLVTMPTLNEEKIIQKNILIVHDYLKGKYPNLLKENRIKLCIAINGSTDNTETKVQELKKEIPYLVYSITQERGRGGALDNTWKYASEDVFLYIDSDLAYSLPDLGSMIDSYLLNENYDMVVASRRVNGSIVERSPIRKILTVGYNYIVKIMFLNYFTDAQAGCKSITREVYLKLREKVNCYTGWFFDTALLLYVEKKGFKIKDLTITCIDNRKWRLKIINTIFYFLKNLICLRVKTWVVGFK